MGFSWAVYLAQQATMAAVVEASVSQRASFLPRGFVYIDNIGLIGKDSGEVDMLLGRICHELHARGLLTHELCRAARCFDILGDRTRW